MNLNTIYFNTQVHVGAVFSWIDRYLSRERCSKIQLRNRSIDRSGTILLPSRVAVSWKFLNIDRLNSLQSALAHARFKNSMTLFMTNLKCLRWILHWFWDGFLFWPVCSLYNTSNLYQCKITGDSFYAVWANLLCERMAGISTLFFFICGRHDILHDRKVTLSSCEMHGISTFTCDKVPLQSLLGRLNAKSQRQTHASFVDKAFQFVTRAFLSL